MSETTTGGIMGIDRTNFAAAIFFVALCLAGLALVLAVGTLVRMVWGRWRG